MRLYSLSLVLASAPWPVAPQGDPCTSSISISGKLVRNADSQGPATWVIITPPKVILTHHQSWRIAALKKAVSTVAHRRFLQSQGPPLPLEEFLKESVVFGLEERSTSVRVAQRHQLCWQS